MGTFDDFMIGQAVDKGKEIREQAIRIRELEAALHGEEAMRRSQAARIEALEAESCEMVARSRLRAVEAELDETEAKLANVQDSAGAEIARLGTRIEALEAALREIAEASDDFAADPNKWATVIARRALKGDTP